MMDYYDHSLAIVMSPHHGGLGGGHIDFSADPFSVGVATCLHSDLLIE